MGKAKGAPKSGGRSRGTPNKTTRAFREAISVAFDELGGTTHLLAWAKENTTDFYKLAVRLVPPGSPINIGPLTGTIAEQGKVVLGKMCEGAISPEQCASVMSSIVAQARVVESEDLERRIKLLEERTNGKS